MVNLTDEQRATVNVKASLAVDSINAHIDVSRSTIIGIIATALEAQHKESFEAGRMELVTDSQAYRLGKAVGEASVAPKWIDAATKPDTRRDVLIVRKGSSIRLGYWEPNGTGYWSDLLFGLITDDVTAWMELPAKQEVKQEA